MLKWLLSLLAGGLRSSNAPPHLPSRPLPTRRIALVVGHNPRAQGAVRVTDGRTEYDWCGALAEQVAALEPGRYVVIRRTPGAGEIARAYAEVDASGATASVELHFNSFSTPSATGTETLISGSAASRRLATLVQAEMVAALGLRDRGLKQTAPKQGGHAALNAGRPPAILIEPYFGSNRADCEAADRSLPALAAGIHRACLAYL
ncbi:MAG: N-acetylmuramoyl-L-alanine amidase [Pigmentiphaga sp.]|nr:N-acetylmuramoyl-L-alanine amidase [Pigmentiphaga sp.]